MPYRIPNLQNEFGQPYVTAGTKKPVTETSFIDINWFNTTSGVKASELDKVEDDKVVLSQTLKDVISDVKEKITDAAEGAVMLHTHIMTIEDEIVTVPEGETYITCYIQSGSKFEQFIPEISAENEVTKLRFGSELNDTSVKLITASPIGD